jgi:hypothetical protein
LGAIKKKKHRLKGVRRITGGQGGENGKENYLIVSLTVFNRDLSSLRIGLARWIFDEKCRGSLRWRGMEDGSSVL